MDLAIRPIKTHKSDIKQPKLAEHENCYIPPIGSSVIISGKSGSGKSTLLANLLKDKRFYNGFFDKVFLFSPTANGDDIQKSLDIPKKHVFTDLDESPEIIDKILDIQQEKLEKSTADKVEQWAFIFDDVIGDKKFMNSKAFTRCFYQVRHANATTFICTQHFKRVPRVCRLQANFVFFFEGSQTEVDTVVEDFAPPCVSKREFATIVMDATAEPFSFLTICMKVHWKIRFRKQLHDIIPIGNITNNICDDVNSNHQVNLEDGTTTQDDYRDSQEELQINGTGERTSSRGTNKRRRDPDWPEARKRRF